MYWFKLWAGMAARALLLFMLSGLFPLSLLTWAAPQLSPQDADMIAQRLERNQVINWSAAGVLLAVIVAASGLLMRHVNGVVAEAKTNAIDRAEEKFLAILERRDDDRERFRASQEQIDKERQRADRAEIVRECVKEMGGNGSNGKYPSRSEFQAAVTRSNERYEQLTTNFGKLEERLSRHGHDLNNISASMEAIKMRLPKQVG